MNLYIDKNNASSYFKDTHTQITLIKIWKLCSGAEKASSGSIAWAVNNVSVSVYVFVFA